jgi:hypothetical protein
MIVPKTPDMNMHPRSDAKVGPERQVKCRVALNGKEYNATGKAPLKFNVTVPVERVKCTDTVRRQVRQSIIRHVSFNVEAGEPNIKKQQNGLLLNSRHNA